MRIDFARVFLAGMAIACAGLPVIGGVAGEWNGAILAASRPQTPPPLLLVRNLAIVHRAAHDAAVLCSDTDDQRLLIGIAYPDTTDVLPEAAYAHAAHAVAMNLFPSSRPLFNRLLDEQTGEMDPSMLKRAEAIGNACATAHMDVRKADRLSATITYIPRDEPGQWRRTPPRFRPPELPQGRHVKPYVLSSIDPYLPPGPPDMASPGWADALAEVREIGSASSSLRTEEQSLIARFWSDFSYTITPPGHWNQIAVGIIQERHYSLLEAAELLAWLNTTMLDAGVVCWEAKFRFNFWRPITAIQRAHEDGNPGTDKDPEWNSYLESPPHPEYPSGHSSFSGAAARFLQLYLGTDRVSFSTTSDAVPGHSRQYESLWKCATEISDSRIFGGIHYRFSGDDGLQSGKQVAEAVYVRLKAEPDG